MDDLNEIDSTFSTLNKSKFFYLILCGSDNFYNSSSNILKDLMNTCYNYLGINVKRICLLFMCIF